MKKAWRVPESAYIVGYGSLMSSDSATRTFGYDDRLVVTLKGWVRKFNVGYVTSFFPTFMNFVEEEGASSTIVLYECNNKKEIESFFIREGLYDIVDISHLVKVPKDYPVLLAIGNKYFVNHEEMVNQVPVLISEKYWKTCLAGAKELGIYKEYKSQVEGYINQVFRGH